MKNFVQKGCSVQVTFASDCLSGEPRLIGNLFGVCDHDVDVSVDAEGILVTEGVFEYAKQTADVFAFGDLVYWDVADKKFTVDDDTGTNKLVGVSLTDLGAVAGNVKVRLNGTSVS